MRLAVLTFLFLLWAAPRAHAQTIEFHARHFVKDLSTNSARGKGEAWVRIGERTIWADEIEVDYTVNRAIANGNVHIKERDMEAWARHASYGLVTHDAVLDKAVMVVNQLVLTGDVVRRVDPTHFEVENGSYSNCNLDLVRSPDISQCALDWKLTGSSFHITAEGYAQVHDALLFAKRIPLLYSPYLIFPVKTKRQSGFLWPRVFYRANLGTAFTPPYFIDLADWQDLTIYPDWFTQAGYHVGLEYRYAHSALTRGQANVYLVQRRFGSDPSQPTRPDPGGRPLGFLGEAAVNAQNTVSLGGRAHSRQVFRLVTHPYYTYDYGFDLPGVSDLSYLRSQVAITYPTDDWVATGQIQHHQSLLVSRDWGTDKGAVVELPTLRFAKTSTPFWRHKLLYEFDAVFNNFYRPAAFDPLPALLRPSGINADADPLFGGNDYLRTGRRLQLEPRLIASIPMPPGFQLQPVLRTGTLIYHFDYPRSQALHREYVDIEVPFALYLSRTFEPGWNGFEKINHVVQPRVIYGASLYQSDTPSHPFFYRNRPALYQGSTSGTTAPPTLSAPRFDLADQLVPFEYVRLELLNRFRRKSSDGISRFFRIDVSTQFNSKLSDVDPRFNKHWGPVEFLSELNVGKFSAQFQANYPLELRTTIASAPLPSPVRETDFSGAFSYTHSPFDRLNLGALFRNRADRSLNVQTLTMSFYKTLPSLFDIDGQLEYSLLPGEQRGFRGYSVGFHLHSRPRHCWEIIFRTGRDSNRLPFAFIDFKLNFGSPSAWTPPL